MIHATDGDCVHGRVIFDQLVRGDATTGLIADVPAAMHTMTDTLWRAAGRQNPIAYRALGDSYLATAAALVVFDKAGAVRLASRWLHADAHPR